MILSWACTEIKVLGQERSLPLKTFFFFFFFFDFLFGGGGIPSFPYDLKVLAEVKERKQCMNNSYVPPCFCFFFFYTVDFGVSKCEEPEKVKNLVNQVFKNLRRCIFYSTDFLK